MKESSTVLGEKRNPLVHLFSQTWRFSPNRRKVILYWTLFLIGNSIALISQPLLMARIMDTIQKYGVTKDNLWYIGWHLALITLINIVFWCFHGPGRFIERINAYGVRANYRRFLLNGVFGLPLNWHAEHHTGETTDRVEKGANAQYAFSSESFNVISSIAQLVVSYSMLAYVSWPSAIIVLAMIGVTVFITTQFDKRIIENYKALNRMENHIAKAVIDSISNITTVIILRVERLVYEAISRKIDEPFKLYCKNTIQIETKWCLVSFCCSCMTGVVLITYCIMQLNSVQTILLSSLYLLIRYLDQVSDVFFRFTGMYGEIIQRHAKVLNAELLAKDFKEANLTNHVLPESWQHMKIEGLNFSYHNKGEEMDLHLDNVSLDIRTGERIALVGKSGSGKTTFLKLMRGLYDPTTLNLSVDGKSIPEGFNGISRAITLVPQMPEIFATTIRENITLGADYDEELIWQCLKKVGLEDTVRSLPHGLDSRINEKGVNLSGGQQQRLALARGILACTGKSFILLDEPTSNVDGDNEGLIYENITREFADKTIIASIHGLHLHRYFHRIVMFDNGRIIATGTFEEMIASCPAFAKLFKHYEKRRAMDKAEVDE